MFLTNTSLVEANGSVNTLAPIWDLAPAEKPFDELVNHKQPNDPPDKYNTPAAGSHGNRFPHVYLVTGIAVGVLVISLVIVILIRLNRFKFLRKYPVPVEAIDKKAFKEPSVVFHPGYASEHSIKLKKLHDITTESGKGQSRKNTTANTRYGGIIPLNKNGGVFKFPSSGQHVFVSIPDELQTEGISQVAVVCGQVNNPPSEIEERNILSSMMTFLPHNTSFDQHILVCFPVDKHKVTNWTKVQLMYSNTHNAERLRWVNLKQSATTRVAQHADDICWFISDGYCFLYLTHFCHVFLCQGCSLVEQRAIFVKATLNSQYIDCPDDCKLIMTAGLHCGKCYPKLIHKKNDLGTLLGGAIRCIYSKEGDISVSVGVKDSNWMPINPEQEIEVDDVMGLCHVDDIFPPLTFTFIPNDLNLVQKRLFYQLNITQGARKTYKLEGTALLKKLMNSNDLRLLRSSVNRSSGPEENTDFSAEPVEHTYDYQEKTSGKAENYETENNRQSETRLHGETEFNVVNENIMKPHSLNSCRINDSQKLPCENVDVSSGEEGFLETLLSQEFKGEHLRMTTCQNVDMKGESDVVVCENIDRLKEEKWDVIKEDIMQTETTIVPQNFTAKMILQMKKIKLQIDSRYSEFFDKLLRGLLVNSLNKRDTCNLQNMNIDFKSLTSKRNFHRENMLKILVSNQLLTPTESNALTSVNFPDHEQWMEYLVNNILVKKDAETLQKLMTLLRSEHQLLPLEHQHSI